MIVILVPFLVAIVGALAYALAANPKAQELGRGGYWVGLFWTLSAVASHVLKL